jgi:hypothetical protein
VSVIVSLHYRLIAVHAARKRHGLRSLIHLASYSTMPFRISAGAVLGNAKYPL